MQGVGTKVSATLDLEGRNDNFFYRTKIFSKRQQYRLSLSGMHAKGGFVILILEYKGPNFFLEAMFKRSQEDTVQISWRLTVKMLT